MTPQESQALRSFLNQLVQVRMVDKDPQAQALINHALTQQPDADYLLVQRALLQDQALAAANERIAVLESQLAAPGFGSGSGSFLGSDNTWGNSTRSVPRHARDVFPAETPRYQQYTPQAASTGFFGRGGGGGSFLGSMAATAAGVAGGAFLFQGIDRLLGNHGDAESPSQHGAAALPGEDRLMAHESDSGSMADTQLADDAGINDIDFGDGGELGA